MWWCMCVSMLLTPFVVIPVLVLMVANCLLLCSLLLNVFDPFIPSVPPVELSKSLQGLLALL